MKVRKQMRVILYSTDCPKCKILESKLKQKNVAFELVTGEEAVEAISNKGFMSAPMLEVDGEDMEFGKAVKWVNELS
jgi:glutaredoxin